MITIYACLIIILCLLESISVFKKGDFAAGTLDICVIIWSIILIIGNYTSTVYLWIMTILFSLSTINQAFSKKPNIFTLSIALLMGTFSIILLNF